MSPENGAVYIMQDDDEEEWVSPTPVSVAITRAVTETTELDADDIDDIGEYVDREQVREVLDAEKSHETFTIEGYDVTIDSSGDLSVEE